MSKTITLELSEKEYKHLLQNYLLGHIIHDEITQKKEAEMIFDADFMNKYCKVGYDAKVKDFSLLAEGLYGFPHKMEDEMIEIYDNFIEYIESGERDDASEALKQQIDEMRKQGLI